MTLVAVVLFALKAFAVVMFGMNLAVVLTWADRRQGAMIQDRVGPNRAVAWLPTRIAQALAVIPALLVSVLVLYVAQQPTEGPIRNGRALFFSQLALFCIWFTALCIAGRVRHRGVQNPVDPFLARLGNPRRILAVGIGLHLLIFLLAASLGDGPAGSALREAALVIAPGLLVLAVLAGAAYLAYGLRNEPRVGLRLAGLLHPAADGLKTIFKEDFIPPNADRFLHSLAPIVSFFPALVVLAVVPFGDTLCFAVRDGQLALSELIPYLPREGLCQVGAVPLQVVNLNVGLLYFFALGGTGIVGAALAGWASDNKYSLLGGLRAASQMVSYEVTLGLTLIGALMIYGTVRLDEMVRFQAEHAWGIFLQPFAFFLFFAAAVAETKRIPFDIPEGESEIVAGYYTEYSGMKFAMFFFAEYVAIVSSSALIVAMFFGGWHLPFLYRDGLHVNFGDAALLEIPMHQALVVTLGVLAFVGKTLALCWLQLMIRWTLPRFRYDQLMRLCWRKLLPASLVNILATGLILLALQSGGRFDAGLKWLGDLSMWAVSVSGALGFIALLALWVQPSKKRRVLGYSSAQFAASAGGTQTARMGT